LSGSTATIKKYSDTKTLHKILKELMVPPGFDLNDKEDNAEILVNFVVTDKGAITVKNISAPSKRLEEYVKERLANYNVGDLALGHAQPYKVKIKFTNN
jgi:hypothetical protein